MRFPARPATLLAVLVTVLATAAVVPAAADGAHRSPQRAPVVDAYGDTPGDATMFARAMVRDKDHLVGRELARADSITSRPAYTGYQPKVSCSATLPLCVHYVTSGPDASTDAWATQVLQTLEYIYGIYQASGYRMPEPDDGAGGNADIDIYLANIGDEGYYGYCVPTTSAPKTRPAGAHDTSAFCVLDNDYTEFQRGTPTTNMEVTAAHEFFHAVQFSYDAWEDSWFMEATAVWMEDEVFTDINDNTQYLRYGPLKKPAQPLDKPTQFGVYGDWIFFRWLTEHRPALTGQLPTLILKMWQRADSSKGAKSDHYSLQAVSWAMKKAGLPMGSAFAKFAAANRNPTHTYSEGAANHYPLAKPTKKITLKPSRKRTSGSFKVDHLAAATERLRPGSLKSKKTKLRLTVDMADKKLGSGAVVIVFNRDGTTTTKTVKLNKHGNGAVKVPFSSAKVKRVELILANASTRMKCWNQGGYSCDGTPKDQNVVERFTATVKVKR